MMDFKKFYKHIYFDIDKKDPKMYSAKQGDKKTRGFFVEVIQDRQVVPLDKETMMFYATRPDRVDIMQPAEKEGDLFRIDIPSGAFEVPGILHCQLTLLGTDEVISTHNFKMQVEKSVSEGIMIGDEYNVLDELVLLYSLHKQDLDNPHETTKAQVGLSLVENAGFATENDAIVGLSESVYMNPLRTRQAIDSMADGGGMRSMVFTKSGSFVVPDVTEIFVTACGGGGGGAGGAGGGGGGNYNNGGGLAGGAAGGAAGGGGGSVGSSTSPGRPGAIPKTGGGGAGQLVFKKRIPVTPGETLNIVVGSGGKGGSGAGGGGGAGGSKGVAGTSGSAGGVTSLGGYLSLSGGAGGSGKGRGSLCASGGGGHGGGDGGYGGGGGGYVGAVLDGAQDHFAITPCAGGNGMGSSGGYGPSAAYGRAYIEYKCSGSCGAGGDTNIMGVDGGGSAGGGAGAVEDTKPGGAGGGGGGAGAAGGMGLGESISNIYNGGTLTTGGAGGAGGGYGAGGGVGMFGIGANDFKKMSGGGGGGGGGGNGIVIIEWM